MILMVSVFNKFIFLNSILGTVKYVVSFYMFWCYYGSITLLWFSFLFIERMYLRYIFI